MTMNVRSIVCKMNQTQQLQNHDNYKTPYVFSLLQDEHGNDILHNKEVRTSTQAFNYYE